MDGKNSTTVLLVRHGHVPGIEPPTFRGRADIQLTDRGINEAGWTGKWIAQRWRPTIVYTSPRQRCINTGRAIASQCRLETQVMSHLDDLNYGAWQSKSHEAAAAEYPRMFQLWQTAPQWVRFPEGESLQDLLVRAAEALRVVIENHPSQTVVMVSHDSFIRVALMHLLDQPLSAYWKLAQAPCAISEIALLPGGCAVIQTVNQTTHLEAMG
jgi:phosphoserine phosphatase